jgi:multicomponent Na+:H+ antiporter subunit F
MDSFFWGLSVVMLLTLVAGFYRTVRGPSPVDRMLATQLFGTAGTAVLLVLSQAMALESLVDVALVLAVLAPLMNITFVRSIWTPPGL